jgi:hypothetical protein
MLVNMFFAVTDSLAGSPRPCLETIRCIIARHVPARLRIEPNTAILIETVQTVEHFPVGRVMPPLGPESRTHAALAAVAQELPGGLSLNWSNDRAPTPS